MADDNDEIIVSLPPTEGEAVITKVDSGKTNADDPVADLKSQFATMQTTMNQRLATAETTSQQTARQLADTTRELETARKTVVDSRLDTVEGAISTAKAEADAAERDYTLAFEAGDGPAMARAQRKMAQAESRKLRFEEAKDDLADAKTRQPARTEPQRTAPADPVEAFTQNMAPKAAAWIRAHPECVTDRKMNARMMAAHSLAIVDDLTEGSDEYFAKIEAGIASPTAAAAKLVTETNASQRRPSSAAAPNGNVGGGMQGGGTEVRLTKGEAQSAQDGTLVWNFPDPTGKNRWQKGDPIGLAEMARRKHEGQKAGLYDRTFTES